MKRGGNCMLLTHAKIAGPAKQKLMAYDKYKGYALPFSVLPLWSVEPHSGVEIFSRNLWVGGLGGGR